MRPNTALKLFAAILFLGLQTSFAQTAQPAVDPKLTVERIFASGEFQPERFGGFRWLKDGDSYAKLERSDIHEIINNPTKTRAPLIERERIAIVVNGQCIAPAVDCGAAAQKRMAHGCAAIVSERAEAWIANAD